MIEKDALEVIKIIKADKKYRKSIMVLYFAILTGCTVFTLLVLPALVYKFKHLPLQSSFIIGEIVIITFLLLFIVPSIYLIAIGKKTKMHTQFPYPGMKVMRDTPLITGKKAIGRANKLIYFGYCASVLSIVSSIHVHFIFLRITHSELLRQLPLF